MAILSHKRLMLWRKKNIFINLSWHVGYGPLLSPFEVLEVPKIHNSSIVWPGLSKTPASLYLCGTCLVSHLNNIKIFSLNIVSLREKDQYYVHIILRPGLVQLEDAEQVSWHFQGSEGDFKTHQNLSFLWLSFKAVHITRCLRELASRLSLIFLSSHSVRPSLMPKM